ncbi:hypothetical protein [Paenibacillus sp. 1A_MP2]|uniref:hypothetical protein n=1 Tax=Paenibacillus sp. 1A_MP2 TaxID=3457495 RepID=UPI003FCE6D55
MTTDKQLDLFQTDFTEHRKYLDGVFKSKEELIKKFQEEGRDKIFHVLSFGAGTQSTQLLEQHFRGLIHYDFIIFADTGAEPEFIHQQVAWWRQRQQDVGNTTPFITTQHNTMERGLEEMLMRYIYTDYQRFQLPVYCNRIDPETGEMIRGGLMPRQCTVDFKIVPVKQRARQLVLQLYGLGPRQQMPDHVGFIIDIGFSVDEIRRIKTYQSPQYDYMRLAYPLVEKNVTTDDSIRFLIDNDFPTRRSRCYLCPFNCSADNEIGMDWDEIIREEPLSFLKACWFDEQLREVQATGSKIMRSIPFLHYSRRPLRDVFPVYELLRSTYKKDFAMWLDEWKCYISEKWGRTSPAYKKSAG